MTPVADEVARSTTVAVLVGVVGLLAVTNVVRSAAVPGGAHLGLNLSLAAVVAAVGVLVASLGVDELGLDPGRIGSGLRSGLAAVAVVALAVAVVAAVPAGRDYLDVDDAHVGGAALVRRVALIIPLGTVVVEEVIFRGVLHGLLERLYPTATAIVVGAVLFGLWHVFPAWRSASGDGTAARVGLAVGTLVATTAAGLAFGWLRARSGSLVAPALAHLATNTIPLTAAWLLAR